MDWKKFMKDYWRYYLILEEKFDNLTKYIEPDEKNYEVFSLELVNQLQAICSEMDVIMKDGKFAGITVAQYDDEVSEGGQEFDADDGQWILEQLFDNGCIDEIKPLVDMAHVDNDEIAFELENIRDMGNGWVQVTLSGYHGQDAFESEIQLNMDDPDTYVLL